MSQESIILDQNIPDGLKGWMPEIYEVVSAREEGWETLDNSRLISEAEQADYHIFITADKGFTNREHTNLSYNSSLSIVVLPWGDWKILKYNESYYKPYLLEILRTIKGGQIVNMKSLY